MDEELLTGQVPEPDDQTPAPVTVVDVHFKSGGKNYYFDPGELMLAPGDHVIIETAQGTEFGYCSSAPHTVPASEIVPPLRAVLRLATEKDEQLLQELQQREKKAFATCQEKIAAMKLDMQLVSAECAFDGSKILFFFTADGRVDFRELVKSLASVFRTRIELRQIGVRDKAKMVGGLGACGRPFCCAEFLSDFQPVSIKMAKTQNLSLNPTKISGTCGRLMCCLKYEQEAYEDLLKTAPKNESFVDTPEGRGTVTDVNLLRQTVKVRMEDAPDTVKCFSNCDICVLRNGKAKKGDPPIPKDLAPISSQPRRRFVQPEPTFEPLAEPVILSDFADDSLPDEVLPDEVPVEKPTSESHGSSHNRRRHRRRGRSGSHPTAPQAQNESRESRPSRPASVKKDGGEKEAKKERTEAPQGEKKPSRRRHRRRKPTSETPSTGGEA
jgi:cell fate regulator YaaT (PSP1 superfamily)